MRYFKFKHFLWTKNHAILDGISSLHTWMENQAAGSSLASRVTKQKLRVTFRRSEARGQRKRVQNYDEVDTCNL